MPKAPPCASCTQLSRQRQLSRARAALKHGRARRAGLPRQVHGPLPRCDGIGLADVGSAREGASSDGRRWRPELARAVRRCACTQARAVRSASSPAPRLYHACAEPTARCRLAAAQGPAALRARANQRARSRMSDQTLTRIRHAVYWYGLLLCSGPRRNQCRNLSRSLTQHLSPTARVYPSCLESVTHRRAPAQCVTTA